MLPIYDITPFTMLDYPDHIASIIWFSGCNYNCKYCYNLELKSKKQKRITENQILNFLRDRKNFLEAVVLSGGECTLYNIKELIKSIKDLNYLIKIDTNGSNPKLIKDLIENNLIDYIALDFKAPRNKFESITENKDYDIFIETLKIINNSNINFEIRTTMYPDILKLQDIINIIDYLNDINYKGVYYIQKYKDEKDCIDCDKIKLQLEKELKNKKLSFKVEFRNF